MTQPVRTAPTLAEVAAAAGVSRSTASRALNDSPRISEETKKRVRAAAKEFCTQRTRPGARRRTHGNYRRTGYRAFERAV